MTFFIFSLPRSGSAWLSVFLTYGESFCYHEPSAEKESFDVLFDRPGIVGAVDTGAYTQPHLRQKYKSFVLKRDIDEIEKSSRRCGVSYKAPAKEFDAATRCLPVIDYHKLDQIDYLERIWIMVTGTKFDRARGMQLREMNIQRDLHKIKLKVPALAHLLDSSISV